MSLVNEIEIQMRNDEGRLRQINKEKLALIANKNQELMRKIESLPRDEEGEELYQACQADYDASHGYISHLIRINPDGTPIYADPLNFDQRKLQDLMTRIGGRRIAVTNWIKKRNLDLEKDKQAKLMGQIEKIKKSPGRPKKEKTV